MINRRNLLKTFALGSVTMFSDWWSSLSLAQTESETLHPGNRLQIPPLMTGIDDGTEKRFELVMQKGETRFFPEKLTPTLGFNGSYLGPTLRFSRNDIIRLQVDNRIGEATAVHWHGMHVSARNDGGPNQTFEDGSRWDPLITVMQPAATCWYHSHMHHKTGEQVYRGLAGMIIIDDEVSRQLRLPSGYGIDDIPLIIQDRRFRDDGTLEYMSTFDDTIQGMQGDTILVNGTVSPYFVPRTSRVRLRILNAANARKFMLAFSDRRPFQVIASDGGFLTAPVTMDMLMLAPGERIEMVADFSDGQPVTLVNVPMVSNYPEYPGAMSRIVRAMGTQAFDILHFYPRTRMVASPLLPAHLTTIQRCTESDAVNTRRFILQMGSGSRGGGEQGPHEGNRAGTGGGYGGGDYLINGRAMTMDYINERVKLGDTEIWQIENPSPMPHPFHVHSGQFQILDRDGNPPPPHEMGYKDTVVVKSREVVRIIMSFTDFSDPDFSYMYHCHMLEHEDRGMMGQFLVI